MIRALIWDVDGTLSEAEETHRAAFNDSFAKAGLGWVWDQPTYRRLLQVTGGKERMACFAAECGMQLGDKRIAKIHRTKTETCGAMVETGSASLRAGVRDLVAAARACGIRQAIATTTNQLNVDTLIQATLGQPADRIFDVIAAGDEVSAKKPAPDVYLLALHRLGLPAADCVAIEDCVPGVAAARAAGLRVLVTPSVYTSGDDFSDVDWLVPDLTASCPTRWRRFLRALDIPGSFGPIGGLFLSKGLSWTCASLRRTLPSRLRSPSRMCRCWPSPASGP